MTYREAWARQEAMHAQVASGNEDGAVLLVEHSPVITFGRRAELSASHLLASRDVLDARGVDLVESDRGGDITFHGPGQLVAYPIVRLADFRLSVGGYVRRLQDGVIAALARFGIQAMTDPDAIGVWVPTDLGPAKICAVGVRIKSGTTLHGVALNVTTDLSFFNLIVPCGLAGRPVTSMQKLLQSHTPTLEEVGRVVAEEITRAITRENDAPTPQPLSL